MGEIGHCHNFAGIHQPWTFGDHYLISFGRSLPSRFATFFIKKNKAPFIKSFNLARSSVEFRTFELFV